MVKALPPETGDTPFIKKVQPPRHSPVQALPATVPDGQPEFSRPSGEIQKEGLQFRFPPPEGFSREKIPERRILDIGKRPGLQGRFHHVHSWQTVNASTMFFSNGKGKNSCHGIFAKPSFLLPKKVLQRVPGLPAAAGCLFRIFPENEEIAEIAPLLVHDPLRLGFPAAVVRAGIVKPAVETDVEVPPAEGTGIPPRDLPVHRQFLPATGASLHSFAPQKAPAMR
jgi:hypothetical protein